jgi:hypothetical protein
MRALSWLVPFVVAGCATQVPIGGGEDLAGDMATSSGEMSPASCSGMFIYGNAFSLDDDFRGPGPVLNIDGSSCPPSAPAASGSGKVQVEIPTNLVGASAYLYLTGSFNNGTTTTVLPPKTWLAPKGLLDSTASLTAVYHFMIHDTSAAPSIIDEVRKSLIAHGDIASTVVSDQFLANYHVIIGLLMEHRSGTEAIDHNYSVQVEGLDNTACSPANQCCVYYAADFAGWRMAPTPSYIDFTATTSPVYFIVVCPSSPTGDITLHQTAALSTILDQTSALQPTRPFSDITVPRKLGDVVSVNWFNDAVSSPSPSPCTLPNATTSCSSDSTCAPFNGHCTASSTCTCDTPVCTPGADQTCNADSSMNNVLGSCNAAGSCACNPGAAIDATTGKCVPAV